MLPSLELIHNAMKYSTDCLVGFLGATSPTRLFQIRGGGARGGMVTQVLWFGTLVLVDGNIILVTCFTMKLFFDIPV